MKEKSLSIGLDFGKKYALVSYCTSDMSEPDTISTVAGSESVSYTHLDVYKRQALR